MPHKFSGPAAAAYDTGRAPYVPEVLAAFQLSPAPARVLDLAAGTGLLSRALLDAGYEVVAVEPDPDMAARQPEGVERHAATAEATGLEAGSVDAVVAGDAWHWFEPDEAAEEVHRVLKPRGRLALVWRGSDPEGRPPELAAYYALLEEARGDHPAFRGDQGREAFPRHPGFAPLVSQRVPFVRTTDAEGLVAEAASASYVNALPDREAFLARVRETLVDVGTVEIPYVAGVWRTMRRRD